MISKKRLQAILFS